MSTLTILRGDKEADFSFCKHLWELSLNQVGPRQDGDELLNFYYDEEMLLMLMLMLMMLVT